MRKGWFVLDGQEGDRTLAEQMLALRPMLEEIGGKTVLDLGCAEGLIAREFARAGAAQVTGLDSVREHIEVAERECAGLPMRFLVHNLNALPAEDLASDVVLCLGVAHKVRQPGEVIRYAARMARETLLLRSLRGDTAGGYIRSKHHAGDCYAHRILKIEGFALEKTVRGPDRFTEDCEYWRRTAPAAA